jgi:hypothetical protein
MTQHVFFDTELTDLLTPQLISIGLVAQNGDELYLELLDVSNAECSDFVGAVVLPFLDQPQQLSAGESADWIVGYFKGIGESVTPMVDAPIDFQLLDQLLHNAGQRKPDNLAERVIFTPSVDGEIARDILCASALRQHYALDDAKALMAPWRHTCA